MLIRTLRRYLAREIYVATMFVFVAFLALFAFFDLINELGDLGKGHYTLLRAIGYVFLSVPAHLYELAPIAVLIGTLYALSHLSANSEYTVMRAAGLSPSTATRVLLRVGTLFVFVTFLIGEFVAPASERAARELKLRSTSSVVAQEFRSGLWVKDEHRFVNVREVLPDTSLVDVRIYEFDSQYRLESISFAKRGEFRSQNLWSLNDVVRTRFGKEGARVDALSNMEWISVLTPDMLSVLFVVPERMSAWTLYQYSRHLAGNKQKTERYEIALWKKLVYPLAALVMMALALPFAYMHSRAGGVGAKVFAGIMIGVFFHMLNSLFAHLGLLQNWPPLFSAIVPSAVFLGAAIGIMWWVERR